MNVPVTVDARLRVDIRDLSDEIVDELKKQFEHRNPQYAKLKALGVPTYKEPMIIRTWRGGPGVLLLPRGGTQQLRRVLAKHGRAITWTDRRTSPDPVEGLMPEHGVELYPYQEPMVVAGIAAQNAILRSPTGSGKTTVAMALASRLNVPTLVVVMSGALMEQWIERARREFGLGARDIGEIRGGKMRLRPLTLAMQQTLWKLGEDDRKAISSYFGGVVCDEVHKFAARTFTEVLDWMPAKYRIGMSADETRKDRKEFLIYDYFGAVAAEIQKEDLIAAEFVVDVEVRAFESGTQCAWYRNDHDNRQYGKLLDHLAVDDARNGRIADVATREAQAGHQVLIFSHRRDHCERLASHLALRRVKAGVMLGGPDSASELAASLAGLKSGELRVGVGTVQAIGTGIDIPTISRGILAMPIVANKQLFGQVTGRLCRRSKGKSGAVLYVVHDGEAFGDYPLRNLQKWATTVAWEDDVGAIIPIAERLRDDIRRITHEADGAFSEIEALLG